LPRRRARARRDKLKIQNNVAQAASVRHPSFSRKIPDAVWNKNWKNPCQKKPFTIPGEIYYEFATFLQTPVQSFSSRSYAISPFIFHRPTNGGFFKGPSMHIDIAVCVTVTRPNLARRALESARSWPTLTFHDSQRRGAAFARNCLIQDALQRGAERVRFLDDDDEITDTRDHLLEVCARHRDVDVIYTDIEKLTPFGSVVTRYTGDPLEDLRKGVYPVLWMTRTSGLMKMRRHHGRVFRDTPCMLGSYWWLDAMTAGLTFRHVRANHETTGLFRLENEI
jgi:hypothetical protein